MTPLEIIEAVKASGADLSIDAGRLVLSGRGAGLPDDLQVQIREHKSELLAALGAPRDVVVASLLDEVRPHLSERLQGISDEKLQLLVNFEMMHGLARAVAEFRHVDR